MLAKGRIEYQRYQAARKLKQNKQRQIKTQQGKRGRSGVDAAAKES